MLKQVQLCLVVGLLSLAATTQTWAGGIQNGSGDFGTIFYPKQAKIIILHLDKLPAVAEPNATIHIAHQVYDVHEKRVSEGEYYSKYGIKTSSARFEVKIPDNQSTGWFNIHIQVLAKNKEGAILKRLAETQIRMAVIPPPIAQDAHTSYFGLGIPGKTSTPPLTERFVGPLQKLGVRWVKEFLQWRQIQPLAQTPPDWRHHDHLVEVLTKAKIEMLFVLVNTPDFAATPRTPQTHPRAHDGALPPKWDLWENFVRQAVRRYRGKVHAWEVWNEANGGRAWGGTPEDYADFFKKTYAVIKAEDPNALVSMTGMTGVKAPWISRLGRAGAFPFM
ncbi:MAG: hypothetical protein JKX85_07455, partial [Phycisphaeraceae bacterium]|nr:hypothetical protein [Phycisphaeraceae bacterium]